MEGRASHGATVEQAWRNIRLTTTWLPGACFGSTEDNSGWGSPSNPVPARSSLGLSRRRGWSPDRHSVEVCAGERLVADRTRAVRVLETASLPTFYLPRDDIRMNLLDPAGEHSFCEWKWHVDGCENTRIVGGYQG